MIFALSDKILMPWLEGKEYVDCSDEAEAVGMAAGWFLADQSPATVAISADGFMNTLNFLTSWIIPAGIPMHLVISIGRTEEQHKVATESVEKILKLYDPKSISYEFVQKVS